MISYDIHVYVYVQYTRYKMFKTFCKKSSKDHTMLALAAEGVPSLEAEDAAPYDSCSPL